MTNHIPQWLRDDPVDLKDDKFDVARLVSGVFDLLKAAKPPLTVSLSGNWGVGKSTIAQGLVDKFNQDTSADGLPACLIDAWTADVADLRRQLVIEAGAALRTERSADDAIWRKRLADERIKIAKRLDKKLLQATTEDEPVIDLNWKRAVDDVRAGGSRFWIRGLVGIAILTLVFAALGGQGSTLQRVFSALADAGGTLLGAMLVFVVLQSGLVIRSRSRSTSTQPAREGVVLAREFHELVAPEATNAKSPQALPDKVVVVVDNLDRLTRDDSITALAEIRSLVESKLSRCLFVVPIDRNAFVGQLGQTPEGKTSTRDYLDKFFNVDIQLAPPAVVDLRKLAADRARELWPKSDVQAAAQVVASGSGGSPRLVTRLLNGMATRLYLLDEPLPSLEQLAVIETLASLIPGLSQLIAHDARRVVRVRGVILSGTSRNWQRALVSHLVRLALDEADRLGDAEAIDGAAETAAAPTDILQQDVADLTERILGFLLQTRNVELDAEVVQHAVLLRADPIWRGITDATALREALGEGGARFSELLSPREDREQVIDAAISQVDHDHTGVWDASALASVNSLGEALVTEERHRVYRPATEAFVRVDPNEYENISLPIWAVLSDFELDREANSRRLAQPLADISPHVSDGEYGVAFVELASALSNGNQLKAEHQAAVTEGIKKLSDSTVARLFDPIVQKLASSLANRYIDLLKVWSGEPGAETATDRLLAIQQSGGRIRSLVADLAGTLAARMDELPAGAATPVLLSVAELVGNEPPTTESDSFADALVTNAGPDKPLVDAALRLELTPAGVSVLTARLRQWLSEAAPPLIRSAVGESSFRLDELGVDYATIAATRWASTPDSDLLAVALSHESGYAHLKGLLGAASTAVGLAASIAEGLVVAEQPERAREIAEVAGQSVKDSLAAYLSETPRLVRALRMLGAEEPVVNMAAQRLRESPDADEANLVVAWAKEFADFDLERQIAKDIAAIVATEHVSPLEMSAYGWLATRTSGNNDVRDIVVQLIESESMTLDQLHEAIEPARSSLKSHRWVAVALIHQAVDFAVESDSEPYLREALLWTGVGSAIGARDDIETLIGRTDDEEFKKLAIGLKGALELEG